MRWDIVLLCVSPAIALSVPAQSGNEPENESASVDDGSAVGQVLPRALLQVPYSTEAVDTCNLIRGCGNEAEEIVARKKRKRASKGVSTHVQKRSRDPIKALGGDLPLKSQGYYLPYQLYTSPRDNTRSKPVFEFASASWKSHEITTSNKNLIYLKDLVTEHPMELQTIGLFMDWLVRSDADIKASLIANWKSKVTDLAKLRQLRTTGNWIKDVKKDPKKDLTFNDVIFHALGSTTNWRPNVLCDKQINGFKEKVWSLHQPMAVNEYKRQVNGILAGSVPSANIHSVHRTVLALFEYMNDIEIATRFQEIFDDLIVILAAFEDLTGKSIVGKNKKRVELDKKFREYIKQHFQEVAKEAQEWLKGNIQKIAQPLYTTKIAELEKTVKELEANENIKDPKKRQAYENKTNQLESSLRTDFQKKQKDLQITKNEAKDLQDKINKVERDVAKLRTATEKQKARTKANWGKLLTDLAKKQDTQREQQTDVLKLERKIFMLRSATVEKVLKTLNADVIHFRKKVPEAKFTMPSIA